MHTAACGLAESSKENRLGTAIYCCNSISEHVTFTVKSVLLFRLYCISVLRDAKGIEFILDLYQIRANDLLRQSESQYILRTVLSPVVQIRFKKDSKFC